MLNYTLTKSVIFGLIILICFMNCRDGLVSPATDEELEEQTIPQSTEEEIKDNNTLSVECLHSNSCIYLNSKPIARILRDGNFPGTGFLVGPDGYFITAKHVLRDSTDLSKVTIEFLARCDCDDDSRLLGDCPGQIISVRPKWVAASDDLDYTILKFPDSIATKYGYLHLRKEKLMPREPIYVPQHQFFGPTIVSSEIKTQNGDLTMPIILSIDKAVCNINSLNGFEHNAETKNGSSGSPIISAIDHTVIGIHQCVSNGVNQGITVDAILQDLIEKGLLPDHVIKSPNSRFPCGRYNKVGGNSTGLLVEVNDLRVAEKSRNGD